MNWNDKVINSESESPLSSGEGQGVRSMGRKKFLFAGLSFAALAAFFKWRSRPEKKNTMKFLTQEGKLVEIEVDKLPKVKRVASKTDIQQWIKKPDL
jgi:hypothetical protein